MVCLSLLVLSINRAVRRYSPFSLSILLGVILEIDVCKVVLSAVHLGNTDGF